LRELGQAIGKLALPGAFIGVCVPAADVSESDFETDVRLDQLRDLAVKEMPTAQWVIAAPGGDQIIGTEVGIMGDVLSGKQSAHHALASANQKTQGLLDEAYKNSVLK